MGRFLWILWILPVLMSTVWCQVREDFSPSWDFDPPASLTVKRSSGTSNIEEAVVLTRQQEQEIVERHNLLRTVVQPSAEKMRKMTWDDELATVATQYSRKCIYEHNKARKHSRFSYIGENLYISTGIPMNTALVTNAVSAWDNEKVDYDYETRTCKPGRKCGHYTQTAWDDTFKVGCGVTICRAVEVNGRTWYSATLFACNYGPGGNYDRHPFIAGPPCSNCDEGDTCEDNLCVNPLRDEDFDNLIATWSEWTSWSTCSKTCLGGSARRYRKCSSFVSSDCEGYSSEITYSCSHNLCDLHPLGPGGAGNEDFHPWGAWSDCSATCGNGMMSRTRRCKNSNNCNGINKLMTACNLGSCTGEGSNSGRWTKWGRWGSCSVTCGNGVQKKKRTCQGSQCIGQTEISKQCSPMPCKTIPRWSEWSDWTECTATCGGGSRVKTRRCLTGRNCEGSTKTTNLCNTDRCRGHYSNWSSWTECSKTCGSGTKTRKRTCVGGGNCFGPKTDKERCNKQNCPEFGEWSPWGPCDASCGMGNRIRSRNCSSSNLDDCAGENQQAEACRSPECTITEWSKWSPWSDCSVTCGTGSKSSTRICNVGNSGRQTCSGEAGKSTPCKKRKCPVYSAWSTWSECDTTCGEGLKTRTRRCQFGSTCLGASEERETCKTVDCTKSKWAQWTSWTACTETCGEGIHTRKRICIVGNNGPPCAGDNDEARKCKIKNCKEPDPDEKDPPNKGPEDRDGPNNKQGGGKGAGYSVFPNLLLLLLSYVLFLNL